MKALLMNIVGVPVMPAWWARSLAALTFAAVCSSSMVARNFSSLGRKVNERILRILGVPRRVGGCVDGVVKLPELALLAGRDARLSGER